MPSLQLLVIDQIAALLEAMKTARTLKQVYYTPRAILQSPEFPFAFFRLAADEDYLLEGVGPGSFKLTSRILVTLVIQREATYATKELAQLIDLVRQKLVTDLACKAQIIAIRQISDPLVANLFDEFGAATLAIDYSGHDTYS